MIFIIIILYYYVKITSREMLVQEIADALSTNLEDGCFYLNLTT